MKMRKVQFSTIKRNYLPLNIERFSYINFFCQIACGDINSHEMSGSSFYRSIFNKKSTKRISYSSFLLSTKISINKEPRLNLITCTKQDQKSFNHTYANVYNLIERLYAKFFDIRSIEFQAKAKKPKNLQ